MSRVLITGAAGFAGHHLVEHITETTDWEMVALVSLQHAGRIDRLFHEGVDWDRLQVIWHDLRAPIPSHVDRQIGDVTDVLHLAAESHVDRSIVDPAGFIGNNLAATVNLLDWARTRTLRNFVQISTDEVYGPVPDGVASVEWDAIVPSNPYAASKACQEAAAVSYWRTFDVPVVITNTMNLFGERQHVEKFVPLAIRAVLTGEPITLHAQLRPGRQYEMRWVPASRHWLHARNHADALCWLLRRQARRYPEIAGDPWPRPDRWNVAGEERSVLDMVRTLERLLGREASWEFTDYHSSRPGHDHRYALDDSKMRVAGWVPPYTLDASLARTVEWMTAHPEWLDLIPAR